MKKLNGMISETEARQKYGNVEGIRLKVKISGKETVVLTNIMPTSSLNTLKLNIQVIILHIYV